MIYLDQEKLDQFFKSVANGFATTPKEVLLFFVVLAVIISFLIIFYLVQRRGMHRKLLNQSARRYAELIDQHKLSGGEVKLIEGMAEFLPPEKQKYLLLTNQHLFNVYAGKLLAKKQVSESTLASARLKLGFRLEQPDEIPSSSAELPEGMPLHIIVPGRQGIRGRIAAQESRGLTLALENEGAALSVGTIVRIYFNNRVGIYSFASRIVNATRQEVTVQHAEEIKQYQRRNFYRRKMHLSVFVRSLYTGGRTYRSTLMDLGGGGASLGNPKSLFKVGDLLKLSFSSGAADFRVPAKVVRISRNATVLHVQFESITESARDRIIGSLYRITDL